MSRLARSVVVLLSMVASACTTGELELSARPERPDLVPHALRYTVRTGALERSAILEQPFVRMINRKGDELLLRNLARTQDVATITPGEWILIPEVGRDTSVLELCRARPATRLAYPDWTPASIVPAEACSLPTEDALPWRERGNRLVVVEE